MRGIKRIYLRSSGGLPFFKRRSNLLAFFFTALFFLAHISAGHSESLLNYDPNGPVNFTADTLIHDEENQIVQASGNVELTQGLQILRADSITYNLQEDKVHAKGNISLLDENGNVFFSEEIELKNKMKEGFSTGLLALLEDGSRFTAKVAERRNNGNVIAMKKATYTMCNVCETDPNPLWQIKADEVTHDKVKKSVDYKNARIEMLGIPVAYTPRFSHPDPTIDQKSGFLRPSYGWTTSLGAHMQTGYYFALAKHRDMTFSVQPSSNAGILLGGEWRERFSNGYLNISGAGTKSDRKEADGRVEQDRTRGHVSLDGKFHFNDKWRGGFDFTRSSDKQYLKLYDISSADVLTNDIYAERFSGRDYSRISFINFQDLRLGARPEQPDVLPSAEHTMFGEPGSLMGGRWKVGTSVLALNRQDNNQDMERASLDLEWQRRDVSSFGLVNTMTLSGRGDLYAVQNHATLAGEDLTVSRGIATAGFISSYPLIKPMTSSQAILEPMVGFSFSPDVDDSTENKIPNEDSVDIRFDSLNLFSSNRFPGIDRQEDGGRVDFGIKAGLYGNDGKFGKVFFGQSYRLYGEEVIFPEGSGLEDRLSDFVGSVKLGFSKYFETDYRFQFDNESLESRRHEAQVSGGNDTFHINSRYIYIDSVVGTGFTESREQAYMDGTYNVNENWQLSSSALVDMGDEPGFRSASLGIGYTDECFSFLLKGSRKVVDEASGENDTSLTFRIGLKHIGNFSNEDGALSGGHDS